MSWELFKLIPGSFLDHPIVHRKKTKELICQRVSFILLSVHKCVLNATHINALLKIKLTSNFEMKEGKISGSLWDSPLHENLIHSFYTVGLC